MNSNIIYVLIIILVFFIFRRSLTKKFHKVTDDNYKADNDLTDDIDDLIENSLSGEKCGKSAMAVIKKTEKKKNKTARDYYNIGTIYACHTKDPKKATQYYNQTLTEIRRGNVEFSDVTNLLYSLESIIRKVPVFRNNVNLVDTLNDTAANTNAVILRNTNINTVIRKRNNNKPGKSKTGKAEKVTTKKQIENKRQWNSDWQNVHDSLISDDMISQIKYLISQNNKNHVPNFDMIQIDQWLKNHAKSDTVNISTINEVMTRIRNNAKLPFGNSKNKTDIGESMLLRELWRRAHDPINIERKNDILDSIAQSLASCKERGSIVCLTGRATRLMSSLAMTDVESEEKNLGILKTKTVVRNEILDRCAKIVEKYVGSSSTTDKAIIDDYNKGNSNIAVAKLENTMKTEMQSLSTEYKGKLDDKKLEQTISECVSSV